VEKFEGSSCYEFLPSLSQENNGGENEKTDEAAENPAEPKEKAKDYEEIKSAEGEEKGEPKVNEGAGEQGESKVKVQVEEKDEAKADDSPAEVTSKVKAEDSPAKVATPEPGKALEPVKEEAEPTKARYSDDKSDEPLITI